MQNNTLSNLKVTINHLNGTEFDEITISYLDNSNNQNKYHFQGNFDYVILDSSNILIIENEDIKHRPRQRIVIFSGLNDGYRIEYYPILTEMPLITPALKNIKKIIIPGFQRYFIYSYEFGIICSASYDQIIFDEETNTFFVTYRKMTKYGEINLSGTLDSEGHLIDDTLYISKMKKAYRVDEHNLDNSINKLVAKIENDIAKNIRQAKVQKYNEWEYDCYLKRKRKKSLEK